MKGDTIVTKVEFGIKVPTLSEEGVRGQAFVRQILQYLHNAPDAYHSLWVSDHLMPWVRDKGGDADALECWTTMSYLAGVCQDLTLGSAVLCNSFRSPPLLAKMAATLNVLTGGRFVLGIGAGWSDVEYKAYGYDFPSAAQRIRQLAEAVQIIRRMWTEDEVHFEGRYFTVRGARCNPRPDPRPPIMIGGSGEQLTLRVVARYADWWNTHATTPVTVKHKMEVLQDHCAAVGRDFTSIKTTLEAFVAIAETEEAVQRIASRGRRANFAGTPEAVVKQVTPFIDLGVDYFILRFLDQPRTDGAKLFAEQVIPQLM
jgi:alkanesulfonate monooxygenase SsuD/methylene tetrahydromethanopterin reductase-like flavin-dependent oxidoreductase (luciferase family)